MTTFHTSEQVQQELDALKEQAEALRLKEEQEMDEMCKRHNVPTVYKVHVPTDSTYTETLSCFLKYPSFEAYSIGLSLEDKHPLKAKKILLDSMWLEGDQRLKLADSTNAEELNLFLSLCTIIDEIVDVRQALIKKKSVTTPSLT